MVANLCLQMHTITTRIRFIFAGKGLDHPVYEEPEKKDTRINDPGLFGEVLTGEETKLENDLIRYSDYIAGPGSSFGAAVADIPDVLRGLSKGNVLILYTLSAFPRNACTPRNH